MLPPARLTERRSSVADLHHPSAPPLPLFSFPAFLAAPREPSPTSHRFSLSAFSAPSRETSLPDRRRPVAVDHPARDPGTTPTITSYAYSYSHSNPNSPPRPPQEVADGPNPNPSTSSTRPPSASPRLCGKAPPSQSSTPLPLPPQRHPQFLQSQRVDHVPARQPTLARHPRPQSQEPEMFQPMRIAIHHALHPAGLRVRP